MKRCFLLLPFLHYSIICNYHLAGKSVKCIPVLLLLPIEGDLYEDGLYMKNGFFRTRHFNRNWSEAGSLDLFADEHLSDEDVGGSTGVEGGRVEVSSQAEAKRRKDRLEREEFLRKFRVRLNALL